MTLAAAVIDTHSGNALMAMAAEERLLFAKTPTDGVFERICRTPIDYHIREQILEQLVLTPTIAIGRCSDFLWDALSGRLKEEGHLLNIQDPLAGPPDQVEAISLDVIAGLVRAAGYDIPVSEFAVRANEAQAALLEEEEYVRSTGREAPSLLRKAIRDVLNLARLDIPDVYSEEEYEAQRRRDNKYQAFSPIGSAVSEYASAAQLASKHDMLLKTPVFSECCQAQVVNPKYARGLESDALVLFRVAATELGRTTYRGTITGCLELANDPATVALREQIATWQLSLAAGDESGLRAAQIEIKRATTALSRLSGVRTVGTITTWLSVPAALTELLLGLPPVLGISVGVVGKIASAREMAVSRKYKWASYGSS